MENELKKANVQKNMLRDTLTYEWACFNSTLTTGKHPVRSANKDNSL